MPVSFIQMRVCVIDTLFSALQEIRQARQSMHLDASIKKPYLWLVMDYSPR